MKLKSAGATPSTPVYYVVNQILYPLVQGCESKDLKIIKVCLVRASSSRPFSNSVMKFFMFRSEYFSFALE